jgi:opacity protein-like surface antigen
MPVGDGAASSFAARSVSAIGWYDFGVNAVRLEAWQARLRHSCGRGDTAGCARRATTAGGPRRGGLTAARRHYLRKHRPDRPLPAGKKPRGSRPMRRHIAAAIALTPLLASPAIAAPGDGLYLEGNVGYSFPEQLDVDGEADGLGLGLDGDIELDDAYVLGGAVGYGLDLGAGRVRLEANVSWRESDLDGIEIGGFDLDGDGEASALVGLVNAYYDLDLGLPLRPYVGGGIGAARVSIDSDGGGLLDLDDEGTAFAWNLAAGLSYDLTQNLGAHRRLPLSQDRGHRLRRRHRAAGLGRARRRRLRLARGVARAPARLLTAPGIVAVSLPLRGPQRAPPPPAPPSRRP